MKLYQLIQSNNWLSVKLILLQLYANQAESIEAYEEVFYKLHNMQSIESSTEIIFSEVSDTDIDGHEQSYVDVSGRRKNNLEQEERESLALEFAAWNEWLGMEINEETVRTYTELEIIAHCLYEMTFIDFDEQSIQEEFEKLNNTIEEYKNMTDEEKEKNTVSLEEFLKDVQSKDPNDKA